MTDTFALVDLDKLIILLVASAFVSGFGLVVLNAVSVAFSKTSPGTRALGGGALIKIWVHRGIMPDKIRDQLYFYTALIGFLLFVYVLFFFAGVVAEGVFQLLRWLGRFAEGWKNVACYRTKIQWVGCAIGVWAESYDKAIRIFLSLFVVGHTLIQIAFVGLWSLMILAIVQVLRGRLALPPYDV